MRDLYRRHYSSRKSKRTSDLVVGPGDKIVLRSAAGDAAFVWRRAEHRRDGQVGVECTLFRNEGPHLSSLLIRQADGIADHVWPGLRHYTFVDAEAVRGDGGGACFRYAGWKHCGRTKGGLLIMERRSLEAIELAWGRDTSYWPETWSADNPAWGQCAVTALLVQDLRGGEIMRGSMGGVDHYWNRGGCGDIDLTAKQFPAGMERHEFQPVSRDLLLANDSTRLRYQLLSERAAKTPQTERDRSREES